MTCNAGPLRKETSDEAKPWTPVDFSKTHKEAGEQGKGAKCQNHKQQSCSWQLRGFETQRLLMHTSSQNTGKKKTYRDAGAHTQTQTHSNSRETFKTKVLIIIIHIHTNTEQGWAGVGEPGGLVKETRGHLGAAFTAAAVIATKVKGSKVRAHAREEEGTVANSQMNW